MPTTRTRRQPRQTVQDRKDNFLVAYENNLCSIVDASKAVNISRQTYYDWCNSDAEFKQSVHDVKEGLLDLAETALLENIKSGNVPSIIFYLKTKGKSRGYVEKQEIEHTGNMPVTIEHEYVD